MSTYSDAARVQFLQAEQSYLREPHEECPTPLDLCVVCGEPGDYCQGHGEVGDKYGFDVLQKHEYGDHTWCFDPAYDEDWGR